MRWAGRAEAVACVRSARSLDSVSRRLASFLPHNALGVSCAGFIAGPAPPPTGQRGGRTAAAMARAEHAAQSPHQIRLRALRAGYLFGRTRQDWRSVGKLRCDLRTAVPPGQATIHAKQSAEKKKCLRTVTNGRWGLRSAVQQRDDGGACECEEASSESARRSRDIRRGMQTPVHRSGS